MHCFNCFWCFLFSSCSFLLLERRCDYCCCYTQTVLSCLFRFIFFEWIRMISLLTDTQIQMMYSNDQLFHWIHKQFAWRNLNYAPRFSFLFLLLQEAISSRFLGLLELIQVLAFLPSRFLRGEINFQRWTKALLASLCRSWFMKKNTTERERKTRELNVVVRRAEKKPVLSRVRPDAEHNSRSGQAFVELEPKN